MCVCARLDCGGVAGYRLSPDTIIYTRISRDRATRQMRSPTSARAVLFLSVALTLHLTISFSVFDLPVFDARVRFLLYIFPSVRCAHSDFSIHKRRCSAIIVFSLGFGTTVVVLTLWPEQC